MQGIGEIAPFRRTHAFGSDFQPYGWKRWFASLFAIYDTDRMIALDLPWWNVAATRTIDAFLKARPGARVFEYGSGASTVWLARRADTVTTVEHDGDWLEIFARQTVGHANVDLRHRPINSRPDGYVRAIDEVDGQFDLVVIDGRHRAACLAQAAGRLKPGGIVVFDDSGRRRYRTAIEASGLTETRYFGRSYCVPYPDHTSLLSRGDA